MSPAAWRSSGAARVPLLTLDSCYGSRLRQIHFHVPSEHTVQGTSHVMEAHCVHEAVDDGTVAVVGVLLEEGPKANAFVQAALDQVCGAEHMGYVHPAHSRGLWDRRPACVLCCPCRLRMGQRHWTRGVAGPSIHGRCYPWTLPPRRTWVP